MSKKSRRGLTLLEVIVSMAIFLIALGAIGQLLQIGLDQALEVQLQTTALQKCQSKLSEVIAGAEGMDSQSDVSFTDNPPDENWMWSMDVSQNNNGINNLSTVQVRVYRQLEGDHKVEVSLGQMVLAPASRGAPNPPAAAATTTGTTSTSSTTMGGG
jgi:prepilin-type N-terminal cleavage/methylation domain-containing protein